MLPPSQIKVSPHFTLEEIVHSDIAISKGYNNTPQLEYLIVAVRAAQCMEEIREFLNHPIIVSSWYRCKEVNDYLKSKDTSQHRVGEAIDFTSPAYGPPVKIVRDIINSALSFDQLIYERGWVHISFGILSQKNRREVLTLLPNGVYAKGLIE